MLIIITGSIILIISLIALINAFRWEELHIIFISLFFVLLSAFIVGGGILGLNEKNTLKKFSIEQNIDKKELKILIEQLELSNEEKIYKYNKIYLLKGNENKIREFCNKLFYTIDNCKKLGYRTNLTELSKAINIENDIKFIEVK